MPETAVIAQAADGLAYLDRNLHCVGVNRRFALLTGKDRDGLIGRPLPQLFSRFDIETISRIEGACIRAVETGKAQCMLGWNATRDEQTDAPCVLDVIAQPLSDDLSKSDVLLLKLNSVEQTDSAGELEQRVIERTRELERINRQLCESQARYQQLIDSVDGIVWEADPATFRMLYVSKQAERILGYPTERWTENPRFWRDHIHPDDCDSAVAYCLEQTACRQNHAFDYRMIAADGRVVWLRDVVTVVAPEGGAMRLRGIMVDITERHELEERLRQSQKMEAIGRLAGGISHDFNNLLMLITGYANLLANRLSPDHPAWADAQQVVNAADRATALTRQLLAFSRKQESAPRVLDLNRILNDIERLLPRLIGEDIHIQVRTAREPVLTRADPSQVEQIIINLAVNARDAMPNGGWLSIESGNAHFKRPKSAYGHSVPPGSYAVLRVRDNGTGMDAATMSRIFEPFFTTKDQGKGTGFGLATVYGIVTQANGHIAVKSELGGGTEFCVYLPTAQLEDMHPPPSVDTKLWTGGTETIMLVEDEEGIRLLTRTFLEGQGYKVLEAGDGLHAVHVAADYAGLIDLLISDVVMPGLRGPEMASRVTQIHPEVQVLYISGYPDQDIPSEAAVLAKPFPMEMLAKKIRELLDGDHQQVA